MRIPALVNVRWLANEIAQKAKHLRILDASWHLPTSNRDPRKEFRDQHIPGAVFFDIDACCAQNTRLSHMLPEIHDFESYVGKLGIDNKTMVVVYDNSDKFPVFSAPRVWWMFRTFGHDQVTVLDGGLQMWIAAGLDVESTFPLVLQRTFYANYQPDLLKTYSQVLTNVKSKHYQVLDARPAGRFKGVEPEPREGIQPGHIINSCNLPFMDIGDRHTKLVKSKERLHEWFTSKGVDVSKDTFTTCGSGVTACTLALAAYICGNPDVAVYDGAWMEWNQRASPRHMVDVPAPSNEDTNNDDH